MTDTWPAGPPKLNIATRNQTRINHASLEDQASAEDGWCSPALARDSAILPKSLEAREGSFPECCKPTILDR